MDELCRAALSRIQQRFTNALKAGEHFGSLLIDKSIPCYPNWSRHEDIINHVRKRVFAGRDVFGCCTDNYREPRQALSDDGSPRFAESPVLDASGEPMVDDEGRPFAMVLGSSRMLYYAAPAGSNPSYPNIAQAAGKCLLGAAPRLFECAPRETLDACEDALRWTYLVYDMAWHKHAGSPLGADRWVADLAEYGLGMQCRLEDLSRVRSEGFFNVTIPDPPHFFYSYLDDLNQASVDAIDILLTWQTAEETQPEAKSEAPSLVTTISRNEPAKKKGGRPRKWPDLWRMIQDNDKQEDPLSDKDLANKYNQKYSRRELASASIVKQVRHNYGKSD